MEENKEYYVPDISELFVGYEFEYLQKPWLQIQTNEAGIKMFEEMGIKSSKYEEDSWTPGIFAKYLLNDVEEKGDMWQNLSQQMQNTWDRQHYGPTEWWEIKERIKDKAIRVRYLTKEQIEGEGWIYDKNLEDPYDYDKKDGYMIEVDGTTIQYSLYHNSEAHQIRIERVVDCGIGAEDYIYNGKCKSVNELRTIMKFIGV